MKTLIKRTLFGLSSIIVLALIALFWLISTESGLQWAQKRTTQWVTFQHISGSLNDKIKFKGMLFDTPALKVSIDQGELSWSPRALLKGRVIVDQLSLENVQLKTADTSASTKQPSAVFEGVELPVDIEISLATISRLSHQTAESQAVRVKNLILNARIIDGSLTIEEFKVANDAGTLSLNGESQISSALLLNTNLDISWSLNHQEQVIVGKGKLIGDFNSIQLDHEVTSPFRATTIATFENLAGANPSWDLVTEYTALALGIAGDQFKGYTSKGVVRSLGSLKKWSTNSDITLAAPSGKQWTLDVKVDASDKLLSINNVTFSEVSQSDVSQSDLQTISLNGRLNNYLSLLNSASNQGKLELLASWANLQWPLDSALPSVASKDGELGLTGSLSDYLVSLNAGISQSLIGENRVNITGNGFDSGVNLQSISIVGDIGEVNGNTNLNWQPTLRWNSELNLQKINPGIASPEWQGNLAAMLSTNGEIIDGLPKAQFSIESLNGTLRERKVIGRLAGKLDSKSISVDFAKIQSGSSTLDANGIIGDELDFNWELNSSTLADFSPSASGELVSKGSINGSFKKPKIDFNVNAKTLRFGDISIESLLAKTNLNLTSNTEPWQADWQINSISQDGELWSKKIQLALTGNRQNHSVSITADTNSDQEQNLKFSGQLDNNGWTGALNTLEIAMKDTSVWQIAEPALLEWSNNNAIAKPICINNKQQKICIDLASQNDELAGNIAIDQLDSRAFEPILEGYQIQPLGQISATASFKLNRNNLSSPVEFNGDLNSSNLSFTYSGEQQSETPLDIKFNNFKAQFSQAKTARAEWDIRFNDSNLLTGNIETDQAITASNVQSTKITGAVKGFLSDLSIIPETLTPGIGLQNGESNIDVELSGNLNKPALKLNASLSKANIELEETGTILSDINVQLASLQDYQLKVDGTLSLGDGQLQTQALFDYSNPSQIVGTVKAKGEKLAVANSNDMFVVADLDMLIELKPELSIIDGRIVIDEANIRLNQPAGVVTTSDDVVIIGEQKNTSKLQQKMDISIDLGDKTKVSANGFDGFLTGRTRIIQLPRKAPRAEGKISVKKAKFSIFSQELDINKGEVFYAGGALDNPEVLLEASKSVSDVKAGVRVTGRVKQPKVVLFSEPSLNDQDILSYLVFEKPVDQIGAGDAFTLAKIANSLRGESSGRLSGISDNLTKTLGLTDFEVNATGADAGLKVGKQISSKLYIGYGYGLLDAVQTLFLRYNISDDWSIQSDLGNDSGADLRYKIERD